MTREAERKAIELIATVQAEMDRGLEHYDVRGKRLTTVKEVLEALKRDGRIEIMDRF